MKAFWAQHRRWQTYKLTTTIMRTHLLAAVEIHPQKSSPGGLKKAITDEIARPSGIVSGEGLMIPNSQDTVQLYDTTW